MRELNVCEVGAVAGGGAISDACKAAWGFAVNVAAGYAGNALYSAVNSPPSSDTGGATGSWGYGNGNGATGGGYSGAGIGGNVSSGSTGSSHFG